MEANSYITQRLAAIGGNSEIEALRAENARLKQRLEQVPTTNFKSTAQLAFEQSPEFESILNAFFIRFMRERFSAEFRDSTHIQEFQAVANKAFSEFEKNYKQKEAPKNAQTARKGKQADGNGNADAEQHDG